MRALPNARPFTHGAKKPASSYVPFTVHFSTPALSSITIVRRPCPETVRSHRHPYATAFHGLVRVFIRCDGRHTGGDFEFAMDQFLGTNVQKPMLGDPSGLADTMWATIVNALGSLTIGVLGGWCHSSPLHATCWLSICNRRPKITILLNKLACAEQFSFVECLDDPRHFFRVPRLYFHRELVNTMLHCGVDNIPSLGRRHVTLSATAALKTVAG